jgi:C-terminal processing protease CtpA/Prc
MKTNILCSFALALLAALHPTSGLAASLNNPDFESGEPGQAPPGWFVPPMLKDLGFTAILTTNRPASGRLCAEIRWPTNTPASDTFANLMQSADAAPWRGKRIKITAAIRVASEPNARAQMWVRVDRPAGMGGFDNMGDRPVRDSAWRDYSITLEVADDAQSVNVGLMTFGGATAWFDNVRLEVLSEFKTAQDPARPLSETGLANLVALARLQGFVRHFHPGDGAATNDWFRFLVATIPKVESAGDSAALATELQTDFATLAPTVRVFQTGHEPGIAAELVPPASADRQVRFWEHDGYGQGASRQAFSIYHSARRTVPASNPAALPAYEQPTNVFRAELGAGVSCCVPTALFADASGSAGTAEGKAYVVATNDVRYSPAHRAARLATVMLAWNVWQHYYPYFDVTPTDWKQELKVALQKAATDTNEAAFYQTLDRLVVQLHDGHAHLQGPGSPMRWPIGARVALIEDKVVVTGVTAENSGLHPGDIIERVNDRPARELFDEIVAGISGATPQWRNFSAAGQFGPLPATNSVIVEVRGADGATRTVKVAAATKMVGSAIVRPPKLKEIKPGIYYVDVTRMKQSEFDAALPELEKAKGIIFEMRGYPVAEPAWLTYLSPKRLQSAHWNVPRVHRPDQTDVEWQSSNWDMDVGEPQLKCKKVFLTDGSAISYAESTMGIVEAYKLGEIVGEPTAGTNGNINQNDLPLDYKVVWTGMKVTKHDGSQHHGVGIAPTIVVHPTVQGIRDGRDEQLERALSLFE